jgi:hypothetical protein
VPQVGRGEHGLNLDVASLGHSYSHCMLVLCWTSCEAGSGIATAACRGTQGCHCSLLTLSLHSMLRSASHWPLPTVALRRRL